MPNEAVLAAIDDELRLSARIEAAKSTAIGAAVSSVIAYAQQNLHGWTADKSAALSALVSDSINAMFERFDYAKALTTAASHAAYRKGHARFRIDAEKVLGEAEPEFKVRMAETALQVIGKNVAERVIEAVESARREAAHG